MRTLVLSDLHLASRTDADVLRRPEARAALQERLGDVDRLVLLGDVLELRHGPVPDVVDAARPTLAAIGAALPAHAEVVLLAGNHDHALFAPWLEQRALARDPLGLEERADAAVSPPAALVAAALAPARVTLAYPGIWLRDDVYATHGHYLDAHVTVPTYERLSVAAMRRVVGDLPSDGARPGDYEALLAPLYAWLHVVARHTRLGFGEARQRSTQHAWRTLTGRAGRASLRGRALVAGFPVAVAALNRLGLGPVSSDLSPQELRRAGLRAMGDTCARLGIDAEWVLFGHTHRAGPLDGDDRAEWRAPAGAQLMNTGSWVHEQLFVGNAGRRSPYWPGTVVELDDAGPPRLRNLLGELAL